MHILKLIALAPQTLVIAQGSEPTIHAANGLTVVILVVIGICVKGILEKVLIIARNKIRNERCQVQSF